MGESRVARRDVPRRLRIAPGQRAHLPEGAAHERLGWDEEEAVRALAVNRQRLEQLQYKMYADGRFGLIIVLQAIDAGGKDGTIRHVVSAFNPQGCTVTSFKVPSQDEARHDYLWRIHQRVPPRGQIAVFNRSHYEDVIAVRVNRLVPESVWRRRYEEINRFERMLVHERFTVVKLFLHISKTEQKRRFEARIREPHKQWKFEPADLAARAKWSRYRTAFEDALSRCTTPEAPWYEIPADHKWFRNFAVSQILLQVLESLPLAFPKPSYDPAKLRLR